MMQDWFKSAKLGIFMHWGIYSAGETTESWDFFNRNISYEDYMRQFDIFTAKNFTPSEWAKLFTAAGAKYAVLTTKHHDGVALWDTKQNDLSIPNRSTNGRDLIKEYADALHDSDIKVGFYFSHLDWSEPNYASIFKAGEEPNYEHVGHIFNLPKDRKEHPELWKEFLHFHRAQLIELCTYQPDLFWFDGDWERTSEQWDMAGLREQLHEWAPQAVLNSRMGSYGDYETPEQVLPITAPEGPWEFCMTLSDSWGYKSSDTNYKSVNQLIKYFTDIIGMGGNLLLNVGPKEDGTFDIEHETRLRALGDWIHKHEESIYPTTAGMPFGHFFGPSTLSQDRKTLYLFCPQPPTTPLAVKGLNNKILAAEVLGTQTPVKHQVMGGAPWMGIQGVNWLEVPTDAHDPHCTVVKITLDQELQLQTGSGQVIESN